VVLAGFKPYLQDQLVSFSAFDTVGLVIWPVKIVPDMTYNVFSGTLNHAQSLNRWNNGLRTDGQPDRLTPLRLPKMIWRSWFRPGSRWGGELTVLPGHSCYNCGIDLGIISVLLSHSAQKASHARATRMMRRSTFSGGKFAPDQHFSRRLIASR